MPDWFSQNAPKQQTAAAAPSSQSTGDWFDLYSPDRKPASTEDFYQAPRDVSIGNMLLNAAKSIPAGIVDTAKTLYTDQGPEDVALGPGRVLAPLVRAAAAGAVSEGRKVMSSKTLPETIGHSLAASIPLIGPAAADAGEDIGSGDPERIERGGGNAIGLVGSMIAPAVAAKVAPKVAPALATMGEQLASKGQSVKAAAGKVSPVVMDIAAEVAGHALGAPLGAPFLARRVLGHVLDSVKKTAPAAKAIERPAAPAVFTGTVAEALATISGPAGFSMPPPRPTPAVTPPAGRVVPAVPRPSIEQVAADALAEARVPPSPARVTTPPPASLPPGYTPRSTVPKQKMAKAAMPESAPAARQRPPASPPPNEGPPKRAYFLRSPDEIAAAAEPTEAVAPSGSVNVSDLPAAWKSHTGQDLFPVTGAEAKEITAALRAEIKDRGMTVGQAIAAVSKNKDIPTKLRAQIIRSFTASAK